MKSKYTKKQIQESIKYWKNQLKKMNESQNEDPNKQVAILDHTDGGGDGIIYGKSLEDCIEKAWDLFSAEIDDEDVPEDYDSLEDMHEAFKSTFADLEDYGDSETFGDSYDFVTISMLVPRIDWIEG